MEERPVRRTRLATIIAAAAIVFAACSSGTPSPTSAPASTGASTPPASAPAATSAASPSDAGQIGGDVSVIGTWTGSEQDSFMAMVAPFMAKTGVNVKYTGTRDINAVLTTGVASGILPDLAGLPGPGQMADFAKAGALKPLDDVLDIASYKADTSPGLVALGTVDGKVTGVFIKAAVKGLIWYDPAVYKGGQPTSWDDLAAKGAAAATAIGGNAKTWCVGLESGAASGWPGTDWIEDIILRQAGPDIYDQWVAGTLKWSSPEVKAAFQAFGTVVSDANVFGGSKTVLATNFGDGGNALFTSPPGCIFHHQASFMTDFFQKQGGAKVGDYDFYPFPDINPQFSGGVTGAGDLFGMFNDTPQAKALIAYLVTPEAQQIWVDRGGALSANSKVTKYPDDVSQRSAAIIAGAKIFRFDGSDSMPAAMSAAFQTAILDFTKDQSKLDSILTNLDSVQTSAYGS